MATGQISVCEGTSTSPHIKKIALRSEKILRSLRLAYNQHFVRVNLSNEIEDPYFFICIYSPPPTRRSEGLIQYGVRLFQMRVISTISGGGGLFLGSYSPSTRAYAPEVPLVGYSTSRVERPLKIRHHL